MAFMIGSRDRALQGRRAGEDAPQRSGAEPVRDRADLRERQRRHRSSDDDDGDAAGGSAPKYGLACLLHEKPFAGVNGSGKHLNWSMSDDEGNNLLEPGRRRRTTTCSSSCSARRCSARSTSGRGCCARASPAPATITASARTKRRRRSSRSSSATCSPTSSSRSKRAAPSRPSSGGMLDTGVMVLPKLPRDAGDRNRTSPFAFTGNKFEFRAVSSNQSIALPEHRAERRGHRVARLHRDRAREGDQGRQDARGGGRRAAAEGDQGEQADHLQRQQLLEGVGEGSRQARPAQPEEHRRRAAAARHEGRRRRCSRSTRSSTSASCTRATRSWSRPTTRRSTSKAS